MLLALLSGGGAEGARSPRDEPCDFLSGVCNSVANKAPAVTNALPSGPTFEDGLSADDRASLEYLLGKSLRDTSGVQWVSQRFLDQMVSVVQKSAAALNGTTPDDALLGAFGSGGDAHNTGYVGPNLGAIRTAISPGGNIREKWALVYILIGNKYFDTVVGPVAAQANQTGDTSFIENELKMDSASLLQRFTDVERTNTALNESLRYSNGIPSYSFEPFNSWSRFLFDGPPNTWSGCRQHLPDGCQETSLFSNSTSIYPPLSKNELQYQCGNASSCKLQWYPGALCYNITDTPFNASAAGYVARAAALGYRVAAGPSGTTANMLELARLFGFSKSELVLMRLAMAAWMLPTNDHSFYEILLGADDFMPDGFKMVQGLSDLEMLMPSDVRVDDNRVFTRGEVWGSFGDWLRTDEGRRLCSALTPANRAYVSNLTGVKC